MSGVFRLLAYFGIGFMIGHFAQAEEWLLMWLAIAVEVLVIAAYIAQEVEYDRERSRRR